MQNYVLLQHPQAAITEAASRAAAAASASASASASAAPAERRPGRPSDRQPASEVAALPAEELSVADLPAADLPVADRPEEVGEEDEGEADENEGEADGGAATSVPRSTAGGGLGGVARLAATSARARSARGAAALEPVLSEASQCGEEAASPPLDVTLVMHASADRLWMLPEICERWGGPMVAVFGGPDADGVVRAGWPEAEEAALRNRSLGRAGGAGGAGCALRRLRPTLRAQDRDKPYPINWLRNRGIACVRTTHYFMVDVDFWPSRDLRRLVRAQLPDWRDAPRALVVPNFQRNGHGCRNDESHPHACREALAAGRLAMPETFEALQACIGDKDCAVFDSEWNAAGQSSTNVAQWKQMGENQTRRLRCLQSARYEPFTVVRRGLATPLFDERFYGYGKNKVSFLVELRLAGFEFVVLGRGFLLHFPHPKSAAKDRWLHTSAHQKVERIYQTFEADVAAKYRDRTQRTPLCQPRAGHP